MHTLKHLRPAKCVINITYISLFLTHQYNHVCEIQKTIVCRIDPHAIHNLAPIIILSISLCFECREICVGAWNERNNFYLHANPWKAHFEATAKISVGLRDYQNDRARSTLAHIFPRRSKRSEIDSTKLTFVRPCVRDGTLSTFTGSRVDPETFSPSHGGLKAASGLLCKATA